MKKTFFWVSLTGFLVCSAGPTYALPRFAAQTGLKCQSCHINPSGGGMRQSFGAQYGREELPVPTWSKDLGLAEYTTQLTNFLGLGADFRTLYSARQVPDSSGKTTIQNSFFQMQGDLYLNFRIAKKVSLYLKKGLYSGFEAFGLLNVLPESGHIKIGKFLPNYGLKLDDHTAFIRTYTGFSPESGPPELTGLEAAIAPGPALIAGGLYNAEDSYGGTGSSKKALLARAEGVFSLSENIHAGIGGNIFRKESQNGTTFTLYGAFGSFNIGDLTALGELDARRSSVSGVSTTAIILYGEVNYIITPGLVLTAGYDFYDPDKDFKTGAKARYSFGFEFFPISGIEVRPMYRILKDEPVELNNNQFDLVFHIYL